MTLHDLKGNATFDEKFVPLNVLGRRKKWDKKVWPKEIVDCWNLQEMQI